MLEDSVAVRGIHVSDVVVLVFTPDTQQSRGILRVPGIGILVTVERGLGLKQHLEAVVPHDLLALLPNEPTENRIEGLPCPRLKLIASVTSFAHHFAHRRAGPRRKQHALRMPRNLFREAERVLSSEPALDSLSEARLAEMNPVDVHRAVKTTDQSMQKEPAAVNDNRIEIGGVDLRISSARDLKKNPLEAPKPRQHAVVTTKLLEPLSGCAEKDGLDTGAGQSPGIGGEFQRRNMAVADDANLHRVSSPKASSIFSSQTTSIASRRRFPFPPRAPAFGRLESSSTDSRQEKNESITNSTPWGATVRRFGS